MMVSVKNIATITGKKLVLLEIEYEQKGNFTFFFSPLSRWMVYSAGVKHGTASDWGFAWGQYVRSNVPSEKRLWMRALAGAGDAYILQRYLDATLDREKIRPQDAPGVLAGVAGNHVKKKKHFVGT